MKRILLILISVMIMIGMGGCRKYENELLTSNKADFLALVEFARAYYDGHKSEEQDHIAIDFYNDGFRDLSSVTMIEDIPDEMYESAKVIGSEFDCLWVNDLYVIFWEDETKYYGLLWSETPKEAIASVKEWYSGVEYHKLENNWYEIGAFGR